MRIFVLKFPATTMSSDLSTHCSKMHRFGLEQSPKAADDLERTLDELIRIQFGVHGILYNNLTACKEWAIQVAAQSKQKEIKSGMKAYERILRRLRGATKHIACRLSVEYGPSRDGAQALRYLQKRIDSYLNLLIATFYTIYGSQVMKKGALDVIKGHSTSATKEFDRILRLFERNNIRIHNVLPGKPCAAEVAAFQYLTKLYMLLVEVEKQAAKQANQELQRLSAEIADTVKANLQEWNDANATFTQVYCAPAYRKNIPECKTA